jgi:hypothetical protein
VPVSFSSTGLCAVPYRRDQPCVAFDLWHAIAKRRKSCFEYTLEHVWIGVAPGGTMEPMLQ